MARINLLPWREQLREERKKQFIAIWAATVVFSLGMIFIADVFIRDGVSAQQNRNRYLQQQISLLDKSITEIQDLRVRKGELLERMDVIQGLQGNRPIIVRVFDEVAKVVPMGVYFKDLALEDDKLTLVGVAESNSQISELMRNFDASDWFTEPNLTAVRKTAEEGDRLNEFDLTVRQINPGKDKGES